MTRNYFSKTLTATSLFIVVFNCLPTIAQAHDFGIIGDAGQTRQIEQSLSNCPSLAQKLDILEKSKGFKGIRVSTSDETKHSGPFLAAVESNEIIVANDWLLQQSEPYSDIRHDSEILPDNLCFALGHLGEHFANPITAPTRLGIPMGGDITGWIKARMEERLKAEARAFLRAWPYVLEAARLTNHGKSLNARQISDLLINLRYRFAILGAMLPDSNPRLNILPSGEIPESDENVAAISVVLANSSIADIQ